MATEYIVPQADLEEYIQAESEEEFEQYAEEYCRELEKVLGSGWEVDYSKYIITPTINGVSIHVIDEELREEILDAEARVQIW